MKKQFFIIASLLIVLAACNQPAADNNTPASAAPAFSIDSAKAAIAASNQSYMDAIAKGDSTGVADHYTTDAKILPANMPGIAGHDAIASFFGGAIKMGIKAATLTTTDAWGSNDLVGEEGTYTLGDGKGNTIEKGKFVVLWKQENGKWKMFRDMWSADSAPPAAK